jgi:dihydroneopterin aldolase
MPDHTESYDKILIRGLRVDMLIGIHAHEKAAAQPVIIDLEGRLARRPGGDDLSDTVCYETLANAIRGLAAREHINLLETFAERIAALCLTDPRLLDVRLRLEKPDLLNAAAVGVEIYRHR